MILDEYVETKVATRTYAHWVSLGYQIQKPSPRNNTNMDQVILVKVHELLPNSNINVRCKCNTCHVEYNQRYSRNTDVCDRCRLVSRMTGNAMGKKTKGYEATIDDWR
jgi:hypothetical protein